MNVEFLGFGTLRRVTVDGENHDVYARRVRIGGVEYDAEPIGLGVYQAGPYTLRQVTRWEVTPC